MTPSQPVPLTLCPGDCQDLGEVMDIMVDAFETSFGEAWTHVQAQGILGVPGVWLSLARLGPGAAGFALSRVVMDEAELLLLAVRRQARRQGIGAALLGCAIATARARGAARLHLEVRDGNGALALYRASGFAEVGRRPRYYRGADGATFDALTLSIALN